MGSGNGGYLHLSGSGFHSQYTFPELPNESRRTNYTRNTPTTLPMGTYEDSKHKRQNRVNYRRSMIQELYCYNLYSVVNL